MINWNEVPKNTWPKVLNNLCENYLREPNRTIEFDLVACLRNMVKNEYDYKGRRFIVNPVDNKLDVVDLEK